MKIVTSLSTQGASEQAIQEFESQFGGRFPDDYRLFLSTTNGGRPDPSALTFRAGDSISDCSVRYFLTLDKKEKRYSLHQFLSTYGDRIPKGLVPIACDSFGNLLLLDVGGPNSGAVYFWDHENENMDEPGWDNVFQVATSFAALEQSLQEGDQKEGK
jgi:SMI1-KNR4 cell-wall